jgi:hypothetical protein
MPKKITITVPLDGELSIETKGYSGPSCKDASKFLEALGEKTSDKNTTEYYATETVTKQKNHI